MKKLIIILLIALPLFLKAQTTPVSPSQMNQVTWYYEPSTTLRWGFNSTRGWFLVPDSAKVVQWAGGGGDTISFTHNFKNTGTATNAIIDLADTIRTNFADFKRGMTTGDPASSMDYHYVSKRNVLGNEVQSRHGVTSSGPGGTYISTYFANDSTHAKAVAVRLDKNYPEYTKLAGLDRHNIAVIDNCVGCTLDTSTYTLTITGGGGGSFLPLSLTADTTVSLGPYSLLFTDPTGDNEFEINHGNVVLESGKTGNAVITLSAKDTVSGRGSTIGVQAGSSDGNERIIMQASDNGAFQTFSMRPSEGFKFENPSTGLGAFYSNIDTAASHSVFGGSQIMERDEIEALVSGSGSGVYLPLLFPSDQTVSTNHHAFTLQSGVTSGFQSGLDLSDTNIDMINGNATSYAFQSITTKVAKVGFQNGSGTKSSAYKVDSLGVLSAIDQWNHRGIIVHNVENANLTDSTLTMKRYVDSAISAHAGTTYSAGNGLTLTGTVFKADTSILRTVANSVSLSQLQTALNLKANLASPTLTGTPAAPTATGGTNTTQIATTAFVQSAVSGVTVPTGANPTASAGATAVNGSATTFMRSDGAPKVDSTVFRTVANSYSLSGMATKLGNYLLKTDTAAMLGNYIPRLVNSTIPTIKTFTKAPISSITGITTTVTDGLLIQNPDVTTSGSTVHISPSLRFTAQAWNTTATAANNFGDFITYLDITSAATPLPKLTWKGSRTTTSTPSYGAAAMTLDMNGNLTVAGIILTTNNITGGSGIFDVVKTGTGTVLQVGTGGNFSTINSDVVNITRTINTSSGTSNGFAIRDTWNQTSTGNGTDLLINRVETAAPNTQKFLSLQVSASEKFSISNTNLFSFSGTPGTAGQMPIVNAAGTAMTWVTAYTGLITGTPTIVAGTGAGTSPTVSVTTNGKQLQVTVTTGTLPTGTNATIATVTLPNALTYTPLPVFSSASAATALLNGASMIYMTSTGTANVTITSGTTALTAATTYVWNISL